MRDLNRMFRFLVVYLLAIACLPAIAQVIVTNDPPQYGPYNGHFLRDGSGLKKAIREHDSLLRADLPWSIYGWVYTTEQNPSLTLLAGVGDPTEVSPRYLAID